MLAQIVICEAPVGVGIGVLWIEPDYLVIVLDGQLVLTRPVVRHTLVEIGVNVIGVEPDGLVVLFYCIPEITLLR